MTSLVHLISLLSLPWLLINICLASNPHGLKHYIVYMGASNPSVNVNEGDDQTYHQLLSSVIDLRKQGERINILHNYNHAFRGFSAMLTEHEASVLSDHSEVVSVFADKMLQVHTTRSWDFLQGKAGKQSRWSSDKHISGDVIIGLIDTGIWPESPSFNDEGFGPIPSRWKGACMDGIDFKKSNCNRKLIGARYYSAPPFSSNESESGKSKFKESPRDRVGHGTHTASIAGGRRVANASYYGLARGTARGGSPQARVASYKACSPEGCSGATVLKAIEDAIIDGVDIISISIGMSALFQSDYLNDPIAIGAFHAEQMGIMVICSAGNDGPDAYTLVNTAPWIFTVAASTIDRDFESTISLGNGKTYKGSSINFANKMSSKAYPLVYGQAIAARFTPVSEARNCNPGSLDREKVAGKIVVCISDDPTVSRRIKKLVVEDAKAKGLILINEDEQGVPFDSGVFSFVEVGSSTGSEILKYLNSTKNPTAKILPTAEVLKKKPSPVVAYFSSRGPAQLTENILKPDIVAPGVAILGAMIPKSDEAGAVPAGMKPSDFAVKSGTSMSCPHVAGAAALIKSIRPKWTSSMVRSALMTTASVHNNMRQPLTNNSNNPANLHETGAGEINPIKALNPGLVLETSVQNYLDFLCFYGYSEKNIRSMTSVKFSCPKLPTEDLISNVNYPSISVASLSRRPGAAVKVVERVVTNVGPANSTYAVKVRSPPDLSVKVEPERIVFGKGRNKASFRVLFDAKEARKGYSFGSITWSDARHSVRIAYSVNVE